MGAFHQRKQDNAGRAGRFADYSHIIGVAAKEGNILMDPFQSHHLIHEPQILSIRIVLSVRKMRQMKEAENAEPVFNGNKNNIGILLDVSGAVLPGLGRRADLKSPAVDPYDDRLLCVRLIICLPYVQIKAFLTLGIKRTHLHDIPVLHGDRPEVMSLIHTVIRRKLHRSLPAVLTNRLTAHKGDPPEGDDIPLLLTDEGAVYALDRQRLIVISAGDPFILTVQSFHALSCFVHAYHFVLTHLFFSFRI